MNQPSTSYKQNKLVSTRRSTLCTSSVFSASFRLSCVFIRDVVGFCVCVSHQVKDPGSEITGIAPFYELLV